MSAIDDVLKADEIYASNFKLGHLAMRPARKLAILACMDARLTLEQICGLKTGEAHIIRNAGAIATEDALRSLIISHHLLGTEEFIVINHTDCGMLTFEDETLRKQLEEKTGLRPEAPVHFHAFGNLEESVREQMERIKSHPWIPESIAVRGLIYDVKTGRLHEVNGQAARKAG